MQAACRHPGEEPVGAVAVVVGVIVTLRMGVVVGGEENTYEVLYCDVIVSLYEHKSE